MSWFDNIVLGALPLVPRNVVQKVAQRYVAGETLADALEQIAELADDGAMATLDVLGEEVADAALTVQTADAYCEALDAIAERGLPSNVSIKLSAFGLPIDEQLCLDNVTRVMRRAAEHGSFVRLDMEDHSRTDATLRIYRILREEHQNVGVVLQAMLRRTPDDIRELLPLGINVRLCKGIYREPPEVAHQEREAVRQAYVECVNLLLEGGAYVGFATHDEVLVRAVEQSVERLGLGPEAYEFQMLLGVLPALRRELIIAGHRLRVYVPYGADWYAYAIRRLRENPLVARHVMKALLLDEE